MPVQQQMSSFAKRLGGRVAQANAEHANAPVDTGNRRLPAGIRNGIAKLSTMYTKEYPDDKAGMKGETFFRASAVVVSPEAHNGEKIAGQITQVIVPLCDVPAKGQRKEKPFSENWFEFQNVFKILGIPPCPETPATDPTGQRTEAYFMAAMKALTDPQRAKTNPVYINFSTRGWTPPSSPQQPNPDEMVFETWHGLATWDGQIDPASGVQDSTTSVQPGPMSPPPEFDGPPTQSADGIPPGPAPETQTSTQQGAAPPPTDGPQPQYQPDDDVDPEDVVASLVEVAMSDPEGATEEGANASAQLEEMAWTQGWSKEQTAEAEDWAKVGDMALTPPTAVNTTTTTPPSDNSFPVVGSNWKFAKRAKKDGAKLKNSKGEEFPAQEVEVVSVDAEKKTCTVKTTKDGKPVVDIRTKEPVAVKFEWLES